MGEGEARVSFRIVKLMHTCSLANHRVHPHFRKIVEQLENKLEHELRLFRTYRISEKINDFGVEHAGLRAALGSQFLRPASGQSSAAMATASFEELLVMLRHSHTKLVQELQLQVVQLR